MSEWPCKDRCALPRALRAAALAGPLAACVSLPGMCNTRVVVVGNDHGGATATECTRVFSGGCVDVALVGPNTALVSCLLSNLALSGDRDPASIIVPYDALVEHHGV